MLTWIGIRVSKRFTSSEYSWSLSNRI